MFGRRKFLQSIKRDLEKRREEIKSRLEGVAKKSDRDKDGYEAKFPEYGRAEDENADEVATFVDSLSVEDSLTKSLEAVKKALEKIEKGRYGVCEKCKKNISRKRLKAFPSAEYCLSCKNAMGSSLE